VCADRFVMISRCEAGDRIVTNEMDGSCSAYGEEERCIHGFGGET
jgi:hypothetical protein